MQDQNHDPLGHVVQDALAVVLDQRLRNLEARMEQKTAVTQSAMNEIRVNHLRGDLLSTKSNDFPAFSGSATENFTEWAKKLEKQMILKGIRDDDDQLKRIFLEFHLRGDAQTKFDNLTNSEDPPNTYQQFKTALERAFPNQRDTLYHRQILKDRRQKRTESVMAYFNELEKLGRLAYPTLDKIARNTILESIFLEGLQADVRKALKFKRFPDLNHLIEEATFVEQEILRDEASVVSSPSARYHAGLQEPVLALQPPVNNMTKQIDQINERLDKLCLQLMSNKQNQNAKPKITCNSCGKMGHYARECRSKIQCEICGRTGHSLKECKSKCFHCKKPGHKSYLCSIKPNMIDELAISELELDYAEADSPPFGLRIRPASQSTVGSDSRPPTPGAFLDESPEKNDKESSTETKNASVDSNQKTFAKLNLGDFQIPKIKAPSRIPLLELGSLEPNLKAYHASSIEKTVFDRLGCTRDTRYCRCTRCKKCRTESRKNRRDYAKRRLAAAEENAKK